MNVTERISLRQPAAARLPSQKWLLAAVAFGTILAPLNSTMIAVALPKIGDTFHVGVRSTGWLVVAYLIGTAVVQPVGGKLGDMFGRRPIFLGALFVFLWFSVGGALAPNLATLLVMRVGQALTAAMAIPNAAALVREEVPEERRMSAYGIVGACAGLAASVGPPIGSAMIALSGWRSMFWLNIPVVVIAMYLAWRTFPKTSARASASGFDWLGVALLAGALTTAALLASAIERGNTAAIAALAISAPLCTVAFFVNEGRVAKPLVHLDLLRKPTFSAAAATVGLSNMAMYSVLLAIPLFIEKVKDPPLSSSRSGETLSWMLIPVVLLSPMAGRLSRRWGRRGIAVAGGFFVIAGTIPLTFITQSWSPWGFTLPLILIGTGLSLQTPTIQTSAVESVDAKDAGMASGVFSLGRYTGSIIGAAVLAAILGSRTNVSVHNLMIVFWVVVAAAAGGFVAPMFMRKREG